METEKTIYLVRHGQSEANTTPIFQGLDSPLSDLGKIQAIRIAKRVEKLPFELLISSPLLRAKETAAEISKITNTQPELNDLFVERIKPASINGKPHTDQQANLIWREWEKSLYTKNMKTEDGENFEELISRCDNALNFLHNKPEKSVVVVTHGYFLRTLVARVLLGDTLSADSFRNFQKSISHENTGLTIIKYYKSFEESPKWHLSIFNDHAHLAD